MTYLSVLCQPHTRVITFSDISSRRNSPILYWNVPMFHVLLSAPHTRNTAHVSRLVLTKESCSIQSPTPCLHCCPPPPPAWRGGAGAQLTFCYKLTIAHWQRSDTHKNRAIKHKLITMNTLLTLGLLCSLAGTSLGLKCWNSDGYKNMRDTNVMIGGTGEHNHFNFLLAGHLRAGVPDQRQQVLLQGVVQGGQLGGHLLQAGLLQQRSQGRDGGEKGKMNSK